MMRKVTFVKCIRWKIYDQRSQKVVEQSKKSELVVYGRVIVEIRLKSISSSYKYAGLPVPCEKPWYFDV